MNHPEIIRVSKSVRSSLLWLESQQRRDGRWKEDTTILELTTTSQVATAFIKAGFRRDDVVLDKCLTWLTSNKISRDITHRFWRLLPLVLLREEYESLIKADLGHLVDTINSGVQIDPRLSYRSFLLECLATYGNRLDIDTKKHIEKLEQDLRISCKQDAMKAMWQYTVLEISNIFPLNPILASIETITKKQASRRNGMANFQDSIAATSYSLINIARSKGLKESQFMSQLADEFAEWLIVNQERKGNWKKEAALYGGNLSKVYSTAIAVRALLEYLFWKDPKGLGYVFVGDWRKIRNIEIWTKRISFILLAISSVFALYAIANKFNEFLILFTIITGIASIIPLLPFWKRRD